MSNLANTLLQGFRARRSIHDLANKSSISNDRIQELLTEVVKNTPSAFNSQSARVVLLLGDDHRKLWDIASEVATASVPAELNAKLYAPRTAKFRASYGTVLFYEDPTPFKALEEKFPMLKNEFPEWSHVTSGMHQYAAWTLLEAEGLGANLQHYNPMLEARAAKEWNVPLDWRLKAQLVFGEPAAAPKEKVFQPVEDRLFVHGK